MARSGRAIRSKSISRPNRVARSPSCDGNSAQRSLALTRRGFRDNLIQYLPTGAERRPEAITGALERFAQERRLPDRGRFILEHCLISTGFPIEG